MLNFILGMMFGGLFVAGAAIFIEPNSGGAVWASGGFSVGFIACAMLVYLYMDRIVNSIYFNAKKAEELVEVEAEEDEDNDENDWQQNADWWKPKPPKKRKRKDG